MLDTIRRSKRWKRILKEDHTLVGADICRSEGVEMVWIGRDGRDDISVALLYVLRVASVNTACDRRSTKCEMPRKG